jgi:hypothetical protein
MNFERIVHQVHIEGVFTGFDSDTLFQLSNGTYWLQAEYKYWYHYAYRPKVEIYQFGGRFYLRILGRSESVSVTQVTGVIESRICGPFTGWNGDSEYKLTNGQVWKQKAYRYQYKYQFRPQVLIYGSPSGTIMDVEGCRSLVRRLM